MIGDSFLDVSLQPDQLRFEYGPGVVGPATEFRSLDAIRGSLLDPNCAGPDPVYGIAMDVARASDMALLKERMLLYGIVAYAAGRLGEEPTRSQGHVHAIAPHSGWSPPEIFEVLEGRAIIYAQQTTENDRGRLHRGNCQSRREGRGSAGMGALRDQCGPGAPDGIRRVVRPAIWLRLRRCTAARRSGVVSGADRERRDRVACESLISKAQSACALGADLSGVGPAPGPQLVSAISRGSEFRVVGFRSSTQAIPVAGLSSLAGKMLNYRVRNHL